MSEPKPTGTSIRDQLKHLEQVQELDLKIDGLSKKKNALPASLKTINDSLTKVSADLKAKRAVFEEIDKLKRQNRAAIDMNNERLARANQKLASVSNQNEFQAATKEIDQLKKSNVGFEEQGTKIDADRDVASKAMETIQTEVDRLNAERDKIQETLSGEAGALESEIQRLLGDRKQYTVSVEPRTLAQYDRVRGARAGVGIAPAIGGRCKGCNMMLPPQQYNELQKFQAIQQCPSCHRLLCVPEQGTSPA